MCHWHPELGKSNEFLAIKTCRIRENTAAVDDGNCLVGTEQDFVYMASYLEPNS